jgi:hypothetical protein
MEPFRRPATAAFRPWLVALGLLSACTRGAGSAADGGRGSDAGGSDSTAGEVARQSDGAGELGPPGRDASPAGETRDAVGSLGAQLDQLDCAQLNNAAGNYLFQASLCQAATNDPCHVLPGADMCGCPIAVVDPDSRETREYLEVVAAQKRKGCDARCASATCPRAVRTRCQRLAQQAHSNCEILPN